MPKGLVNFLGLSGVVVTAPYLYGTHKNSS